MSEIQIKNDVNWIYTSHHYIYILNWNESQEIEVEKWRTEKYLKRNFLMCHGWDEDLDVFVGEKIFDEGTVVTS